MWITDSNSSRNFLGQNYRFQSPRIPDSTSKIRVTLPRVNKKQSRFSSVITTNVSITCKFATLPTLKHPSTLFGTEVRGYSISRFGRDSIFPGFYLFRNFEGKNKKRALHVAIQAFSTSSYFSKSLKFVKFLINWNH